MKLIVLMCDPWFPCREWLQHCLISNQQFFCGKWRKMLFGHMSWIVCTMLLWMWANEWILSVNKNRRSVFQFNWFCLSLHFIQIIFVAIILSPQNFINIYGIAKCSYQVITTPPAHNYIDRWGKCRGYIIIIFWPVTLLSLRKNCKQKEKLCGISDICCVFVQK